MDFAMDQRRRNWGKVKVQENRVKSWMAITGNTHMSGWSYYWILYINEDVTDQQIEF